MKREAISHTKMGRLARLLGLEPWGAVGIMESLWNLTARQAPRGDIGKLNNEDIAYSIGWAGDATVLVDALVASKLLDPSQEFRVVVHDWSEHADDVVHMRLARTHQYFADGKLPKITKIPKDEREKILAFYEGNNSHKKGINSRKVRIKADSGPLPSLALPSLALDKNICSPADAEEPPSIDSQFEEFWGLYWRKDDRAAAKKAFVKQAKTESARARIIAAVKSQSAEYLGREKEFRPLGATWLNKRRFEDSGERSPPTAETSGQINPNLFTD